MAFNPFHGFRRHQKKVFAGLTIMCMFIFVLSSGMGRGDLLSQMSDWFAGRTQASQAPAKLYGKDVDEATLFRTKLSRTIANAYMYQAVERADFHFLNQVIE